MFANVSSSRVNVTPKDFIKQFIRRNPVSKGALTWALLAQRGLKFDTASDAGGKVEQLVTSGHIEVRCGKCYWNDIMSPRVPHGGPPGPSNQP